MHKNTADPVPNATNTALERLFHAVHDAKIGHHEAIFKILVVTRNRFLCKDDILELRMRHSEVVDLVVPLSAPGCRLTAITSNCDVGIIAHLSSSPGAMLLKQSKS